MNMHASELCAYQEGDKKCLNSPTKRVKIKTPGHGSDWEERTFNLCDEHADLEQQQSNLDREVIEVSPYNPRS